MHQDDIDAVVSEIYEAPLNMSSWAEAIDAVASLLRAAGGAQFQIFDLRRGRIIYSRMPAWISPADEDIYNTQFAADDPRRALIMETGLGEWSFDQEHFDSGFVRRSEMYDFLIRHNIRYAAAARLCDADSQIAAVGVFRAPNQSEFDTGDKNTLAALSSHLVRAARFTIKLEQVSERADLGIAALHALADALVIVDKQLRVVFHNKAAEALFQAATAVKLVGGFLHVSHIDDAHALSASISDAIERGVGATLKTRDKLGNTVSFCSVLPVPDATAIAQIRSQKLALLAFSGSVTKGANVAALSALFGLTPAEARVAELLSRGTTPLEASTQLGTSIHTIRTQLKQIFEKTHTHRQAELVALLRRAQL